MTRMYWGVAIFLIIATTAATVWLSSTLPDQIPTHWNIRGEVDGHGGKWTLFISPAFMIGMLGLFSALPAISPKNFEVSSFRSTYLFIMLLVIGLFAYLEGVLLYVVHRTVANQPAIDPGRAILAGVFLFFALMGAAIGSVRKNFYIGVRVPWTLASDRVWDDTHRMAGWIWGSAGAIGLAMIVLGAPLLAALALFIASMLIPIIYSFTHYKSLERRGEL